MIEEEENGSWMLVVVWEEQRLWDRVVGGEYDGSRRRND